jgi:formylglycine-generating enzyme required for sulfatase activity
MKTLMVLAVLPIGSAAQASPIDTVAVGDAGNGADANGYGAVAYEYKIGKYEVTIGQYTTFLNAVAATDTYSLYHANMAADGNIAGIARSGSSGSYSYSVLGSGSRPITYVSWFDAARFANWVNNGATAGASTETGAYTLNGASSGIITKNAGATWWIPSEDEWYKAAYYKGGGSNSGYWDYPTQSDSAPGNMIGGAANQANYMVGGKFAVTQSDSMSSSQNYLTDAGAFSNSASAYGTFDQGGNVWELNDAVAKSTRRGVRGASWLDDGWLNSDARSSVAPESSEDSVTGFRVASAWAVVPEPHEYALLAGLGLVGFAVWRRRAVR